MNASESSTFTAEYDVAGMTCGHCEASVREEVGELDGVTAVHADHASGRVRIDSDRALSPAEVRAAITEAGYTLV